MECVLYCCMYKYTEQRGGERPKSARAKHFSFTSRRGKLLHVYMHLSLRERAPQCNRLNVPLYRGDGKYIVAFIRERCHRFISIFLPLRMHSHILGNKCMCGERREELFGREQWPPNTYINTDKERSIFPELHLWARN